MEDFWSSRLPLALAAQKEKNAEIHVLAPNASRDSKLKNHGFHGHDLPESGRGFSLKSAILNISALRKNILEINPDIVHVITLKYSFLTGLAVPRKTGTRLVFTIAGLGYLFSDDKTKPLVMRWLLTPLIRHALRHPSARLTFQNPDDMSIFINRKIVDTESCTLIPGSGVDLNKFMPGPPVATEKPIVLMPTRLVHDKGISVFIDMAKILDKRGVQARFQIAGGITDQNPRAIKKEEMEKMVAASPVEWLGKVSDMPALFNASTLIVYPSWYREGIPRVLLEAAASGRAIITTDHPGCRDAVAHNDNGLLVQVRDAASMADAVEELLNDPVRRKSMEQRSRERAIREFDVQIIARKTLEVYKF